MLKALLLVSCLGQVWASEVPAEPADCDMQCRSLRAVDGFLDKLSDDNVQVSEGVKFVKTNDDSSDGRSVRNSFLTRFKRFLTSHELQVKLPDLLPRKQDISNAVHAALGYLNELQTGKLSPSSGIIFRFKTQIDQPENKPL